MTLDYAWEKLANTVSTLAELPGSVQERLNSAYVQFMRLRQDDLPPDLWQKYVSINERLTRVPAVAQEGTVAATTRVMSDREASQIAGDIFWLYDAVAQLYGRKEQA